VAQRFIPLEFSLIEQGRFEEAVNEQLRSIQSGLVEYVRKYGHSKTKGAKAELGLKIELKFEGRDENDYSVKASLAKKVPIRPPVVTTAMSDEEQDGTPALFVKCSGSTTDNPRQSVLCTDDGRTVDLETQEVTE